MSTSLRPTLVLLHGFPMDSRLWDRALPLLSPRFRTLALDLPGFGGTAAASGSATAGPATIRGIAEWLEGQLDAAGVSEPCILCGLSMGGYVALEFAAGWPHRLSRLVLCDTKTAADDDAARQQRLEMAQRLESASANSAAVMGEIAGNLLPRMLSPLTFQADHATVAELREMILQTSPAAIVAAQRAMAARRDTSEVLRDLPVPLLCVVGDQDALTPPAVMREMADAAPRGSLVIIPGAGHCAPLEQPAQFSDALIEFANAQLA